MPLKITDNNLELLMDTYARKLKYYSGRLCSCVGENNGQPKIGCGCNLGFWYDTEPEIIYGIRTNYDYKFLSTPYGRVYDGGARFTIPKYFQGKLQNAFHKIAQGDIIVVEDTERRDAEILLKGGRDYLYSLDIQNILSVSQKNIVYLPQTDYIVENNQIIWLPAGNKPLDGEYYSVEYTCKQQFKVWENGAKTRGVEGGDNLPINVMCVLRRYTEPTNDNKPIDNFNTEEKLF